MIERYECPKCGQRFSTEVRLSAPPVCARRGRSASHPVVMVKVIKPVRA